MNPGTCHRWLCFFLRGLQGWTVTATQIEGPIDTEARRHKFPQTPSNRYMAKGYTHRDTALRGRLRESWECLLSVLAHETHLSPGAILLLEIQMKLPQTSQTQTPVHLFRFFSCAYMCACVYVCMCVCAHTCTHMQVTLYTWLLGYCVRSISDHGL